MVDPMDTTPAQLDQAFNEATKPAPEALAHPVAVATPQAPIAQAGPVNVITPDGQLVSIPGEQMSEALKGGYRMATPDEVGHYAKEQKFGTIGQQVATGLEGAASAATFGLSTGLERAAGVPAEDINARREINPNVHAIGEMGGLAASMFTGQGEGALLEHAGSAAAKALIPGARGAFEAGEALNAAKVAGEGVEAAAEAAKLARLATPTLDRIGSAAVKGIVENGMFQSGDEVSKMLASDPNQTVATAAADVGLSGLIGGAFGGAMGGAGKLWDSTVGPKLEGALKELSGKVGGIEGMTPDPLKRALDESGLEVAPEIRSVLSGDTRLQEMSRILENSDTATGMKHQEQIQNFFGQADAAMTDALGRPIDKVSDDISHFEHGKRLGQTLSDEVKERVSPLSEQYEKWKESFKDVGIDASRDERLPELATQRDRAVRELGKAQRELNAAMKGSSPDKAVEVEARIGEIQERLKALQAESKAPGTTDKIQDQLAKLIEREGWYTDPSGRIMSELSAVQRNLGNIKNLNDLSNLIKTTGERFNKDFTDKQLSRAGQLIKGVMRDAEGELIETHLANKDPLALEKYSAVRQGWAKEAQLVDQLEDRLHLKASTSGYAKALKEAANTDGEALIRKLSGTKDADLLKVLQENFPKTAKALQEYHVDSLLSTAARKAKAGESISAGALVKGMQNMSPELRNFAISPKAQAKIAAVDKLLDQFKMRPQNFSQSGRFATKLMENLPGSAAAMATMFMSHNPAVAGVVAGLTKYLGRDVPDAARLAVLKFMGASREVSGGGFKAAVDAIQATINGERLLTTGVKNIFTAGRDVLPQSYLPKETDRKRLDAFLLKAQQNPEMLAKMDDHLGHYMPGEQQAAAQTTMRAVTFLNSQRPASPAGGPLDTKLPPSPDQQAKFNRVLDLANAPLSVLNGVKSGRITPDEVIALHQLYPDLYQRMASKLMDQVQNTMAKGGNVPYATRMGLSLFLGQPMDSTMTPQAILSNQPTAPQNAPQEANGGGQGRAPAASSMKGLSKLPSAYMTAGQARTQEKGLGK